MRMYWWLILILLDVSESILVYQSTITMTQKVLSGLHFENVEKLESKSSFSLCIRFNYQRLSLHNEARIFEILDLPFLWLTARYPYTWFGLGHFNWILREIPDNYIMWIPTKWHHLCLSFSDLESSIKVVKVCASFKVLSKYFLSELSVKTFLRSKVKQTVYQIRHQLWMHTIT